MYHFYPMPFRKALLFLLLVLVSVSVSAQVSITSFSPVLGPIGSTVTISGNNFDPVTTNDIVYFGAVKAQVTSASASSLKVIVPAGAAYAPVTVTADGLTAYAGAFDVTFPGNIGNVPIPDSAYLQFTNPPVGVNQVATVLSDIDGDGKPDLVLVSSLHLLQIYRNTSSGDSVSIASGVSFNTLSTTSPRALAMGDINGDGKPDVVVGTDSGISVFINTSTVGSVSFAPRVDFAEPSVVSLSITDIDKDGIPDIVFCNTTTELGILRNTTSGGTVSFAPIVSFATDGPEGYQRGGTVATRDMNGDGLTDIVVTDGSYFSISIFPNTSTPGNISLGTKVDLSTGDDPYWLAIADFDGDGKPDIAVATADQSIAIMQNTSVGGTLSFVRGALLSTGTAPEAMAVTDIDGDGKPDIGIANGSSSGSTYLFHNLSTVGSFVFSAPTIVGTTPVSGQLAFDDLTGDGPPEMVVQGTVGLNVVKNDIAAPIISGFSPTSGSPGDTIRITGSKMTLASTVKFGNTPAASFQVVSDSVITAVVGMGASGSVSVSSMYGTRAMAGFTYVYTPVMTSFTPAGQYYDSLVTIHGHKLTGATAVSFGGTPALSFTVVSDSVVTALVSSGSSGSVSLTTPYGSTSLAGFTYLSHAPTITSTIPTSGGPDQQVIIIGTNLINVTPQDVTLGGVGVTSAYAKNADTLIVQLSYFNLPGNLVVATAAGTAVDSNFTFFPPPSQLYYFSPTSGDSGTQVTIHGFDLLNISNVSFGGVPATSFYTVGDSEVVATVGAGASGNVVVTMKSATDTLSGFTYVYQPSTITSFAPTSAATGSVVTITGTNFTGATAVSFGGVSATSFKLVSSTTITAVVGPGASGNISVVTPRDTAALSGFSYIAAPTIQSFTPQAATIGDTVTIIGSHFTTATAVTFNGTFAVSFTVVSDSVITAVVGQGTTGAISVITPAGNAFSSSPFTYIPTLQINAISPDTAVTGMTVSITGAGFTGATAVSFGGTPVASFTVVSDSLINAVVGTGGTGKVSVTTPRGTVAHLILIFPAPPTITSFTPTSAGSGSQITLSVGDAFSVTGVSIGGVPAASFSTSNGTTIVATVGNGSSGYVTVTNGYGSDSLAGFTYLPPAITSFSPRTAGKDSTVVITGVGFTGATAVSFGGTPAASFTVVSPTTITAVVTTGTSGNITVTTPNGTATLSGFTYNGPMTPVITSFIPTTATTGDTVIITGTGFSLVTAVSFGGTPAKSFIDQSATTIRAVVGSGSSGNIVITVERNGTGSTGGFTFVTPPTVTSFSPTTAGTDSTIVITGTNFTGATAVSFGGVPAASFSVVSSTTITAVVGSGASGNVAVTTPDGTAILTGFTYTVPTTPTITSFSPTTTTAGSTVVITGTNLTGATSVSFGGTPAASFTVVSSTSIAAVVGSGASGNVVVKTPAGSDTLGGFTYTTPPPIISSFAPQTGTIGDVVTITGAHFTTATAVTFNGSFAASFTVVSDSVITAVVAQSSTGPISVITPYGTAISAGTFTYIPTLQINAISPDTAVTGMTVSITGAGFTGATAVSFAGTPAASFTVVSDSLINAVVGTGGTGKVSVTTPRGTVAHLILIFPAPPTITSFTPTSASSGSPITLSVGDAFSVTGVSIGGVPAAGFSISNGTTIVATVGSGASGYVTVTNGYGSDSLAGFTYIPPAITSFSPTTAATDSTVVITGTNFTGATAVSFGGVPATSFRVVSSTTITAVVGSGASGSVVVTTPNGTASLGGFTYIAPPPAPTIASFTPTTGSTDTTVIITGANFTGATAVSFGGVSAASFTVVSSTTINAVVGSGASGNVVVTTPNGTATLGGFTYGIPPTPTPTITSFSPTTAPTDSTVVITGTNFTGATAVSFGGVPATSFRVVFSTTITAVVGSGASGNVVVTTPNGTASLGGFTYIAPPPPAPTIASFTPTTGSTDTTVIITGANFTGATAVSFGGTPATSFSVVSSTSIAAVIGAGASGNVVVTTPNGTATLGGFTYSAPAPSITSFAPVSGAAGTQVTITGTNLSEVNSVSFGGTAAESFTVLSATSIQAVVGEGANGAVTLGSPDGTATLPGFTYLPPFVLLNFTGALNNNQAQLQWQTQNEQAVSLYTIERSQDSAVFNPIGTQTPQHGLSTNSYSFSDPNLEAGKNYYQIQVTDTAGNLLSSSGVVVVRLPGNNNAVTVYPNPAKGVVNITVPSSNNPATVQIVDLNGNVFGTMSVAAHTSQVTVNFTGAPGGIYVLTWSDGTRKLVKKMMVIN